MKCEWGFSGGKGPRYLRVHVRRAQSLMLRTAYVVLLLAVFSTQVLAGDLGSAYTELKSRGIFGRSAKDVGQLCEHLARLELEKQYPRRRFELEIGIGYGPARSSFKGELDVVVFDRGTQQAVLVAEVKCWGDLYDAATKARQQRRRFQKAMQSGEFVGFFPVANLNQPIDRRRFEPLPEFILISQKGGERAGFNVSMEYSLEEIKVLLRMLQECDTLQECRALMEEPEEMPLWAFCEDYML